MRVLCRLLVADGCRLIRVRGCVAREDRFVEPETEVEDAGRSRVETAGASGRVGVRVLLGTQPAAGRGIVEACSERGAPRTSGVRDTSRNSNRYLVGLQVSARRRKRSCGPANAVPARVFGTCPPGEDDLVGARESRPRVAREDRAAARLVAIRIEGDGDDRAVRLEERI